jgi:hypothetical protein
MAAAETPVSAGSLERVGLDAFGVIVVARGRACDELSVCEACVNDLSRHRIRKRDVAADIDPEP